MNIFGKPVLIRLDPAGPFRAKEFLLQIEDFGLHLDPTPGEAHWKNSIVKRLIGVHKVTLEGIARAYPDFAMQEIHDLAAWAHMHCYMHRGFTPAQLLLGAQPEGLEPDPLSDAPNLARLSDDPGDSMRATQERQDLAKKSHREAMASDRLRRAAIARTRVNEAFPSGTCVWYWRERRIRQIKGRPVQGGWKGPGTVLQQEKRQDGTLRGNVWLVVGGRLLKCVPEHIRLASGAEKYSLLLRQRSGDLGSLPGCLHVTGELSKGEYEDLTGQRYGPEDEDFHNLVRWSFSTAPTARSHAMSRRKILGKRLARQNPLRRHLRNLKI